MLTSTMPLGAAVIGWLAFGTRIAMLGSFGLITGFAGIAFLAWPGAGAGIALGPALFVVAGSGGWAAAVVVASRSGIQRRPVLITSLQMLVGGGLQIVVGLAAGEAAQVVPYQPVPAIPVFVYLVAVPSLIGFPLFTCLLSEVSIHVANLRRAGGRAGAGLAATGRAGTTEVISLAARQVRRSSWRSDSFLSQSLSRRACSRSSTGAGSPSSLRSASDGC